MSDCVTVPPHPLYAQPAFQAVLDSFVGCGGCGRRSRNPLCRPCWGKIPVAMRKAIRAAGRDFNAHGGSIKLIALHNELEDAREHLGS